MGVTYVIDCHTLRPLDTECKHLAFNVAMIDLKNRVCLPNSPGGGGRAYLANSLQAVLRVEVFSENIVHLL